MLRGRSAVFVCARGAEGSTGIAVSCRAAVRTDELGPANILKAAQLVTSQSVIRSRTSSEPGTWFACLVRRKMEIDTMARLTSHQRDKLPESQFALPGHRYPIEDAAHAKNAKARAAQQVKKGKLSAADKKKVDEKADQVLKRS